MSKRAPRRSPDSDAFVPHSWPVRDWPASVYPGNPKAGRWLVRSHRGELVAATALGRVGKSLVIIGPRYVRWLEKKSLAVGDFESNNPRMRVSPVPAEGGTP